LITLQNEYVNFISADGSLILSRSINRKDNGWMKTPTCKARSELSSIWMPECKVDIFTPFEVHIAEGIFDILNIYKKDTNSLYMAMLGNDYMRVVNKIIQLGCISPTNAKLNIYLDTDILEDKNYLTILLDNLNKVKWCFKTIELKYNSAGKDIASPNAIIKTFKNINNGH